LWPLIRNLLLSAIINCLLTMTIMSFPCQDSKSLELTTLLEKQSLHFPLNVRIKLQALASVKIHLTLVLIIEMIRTQCLFVKIWTLIYLMKMMRTSPDLTSLSASTTALWTLRTQRTSSNKRWTSNSQ
jgi:hypothetical protein